MRVQHYSNETSARALGVFYHAVHFADAVEIFNISFFPFFSSVSHFCFAPDIAHHQTNYVVRYAQHV
jgi:hypothetical protein